jgi:hypothetical protein
MEDKLRKLFTVFTRQQNQKNRHHLQSDNRSAGTDLLKSVARPHISLKARMLGGQAKTIMRLGGSMR